MNKKIYAILNDRYLQIEFQLTGLMVPRSHIYKPDEWGDLQAREHPVSGYISPVCRQPDIYISIDYCPLIPNHTIDKLIMSDR